MIRNLCVLLLLVSSMAYAGAWKNTATDVRLTDNTRLVMVDNILKIKDGCLRYDSSKLEYSNDCTSYSAVLGASTKESYSYTGYTSKSGENTLFKNQVSVDADCADTVTSGGFTKVVFKKSCTFTAETSIKVSGTGSITTTVREPETGYNYHLENSSSQYVWWQDVFNANSDVFWASATATVSGISKDATEYTSGEYTYYRGELMSSEPSFGLYMWSIYRTKEVTTPTPAELPRLTLSWYNSSNTLILNSVSEDDSTTSTRHATLSGSASTGDYILVASDSVAVEDSIDTNFSVIATSN